MVRKSGVDLSWALRLGRMWGRREVCKESNELGPERRRVWLEWKVMLGIWALRLEREAWP